MTAVPFRLRTVARRAAAPLALGLALLMAPLAGAGPLTAAHADGSAVTVTGQNVAWDPLTQQPLTDAPTVTVSQTENLVDQVVHVSWTHFTPSNNDLSYSSAPVPPVIRDPLNTGNIVYPVDVLECRGADPQHSFAGFGGVDPKAECYLTPPGTLGAHGAGNAVLTVTNPDGSGYADIHIETAVTNDFLGCDQNHPCSLVVVPNWGGTQRENQPVDCADHSNDYPTAANDYNGDTALDTRIGYPCSWDDRLTVPLHFAPLPTDCPNRKFAFASAGSPMLQRAMAQWQPGWCTGGNPVTFDYNSASNEELARQAFLRGGSGALTSATDVAFVTRPAATGGSRRFIYAPVATTTISIAFLLDDPTTGQLIPDITLNARLLAKMLTQSYAVFLYNCSGDPTATKQGPFCDPAVKGNPASIVEDPEFLALNPRLDPSHFSMQNLALGQFLPTVSGGNSDLTWELTRWIAADPDAAAFLAGKADPWGMHVNDYYRGQQYPTEAITPRDPGYTDPKGVGGNGTMQNTWAPVNGLDKVAQTLVSNQSTATDTVLIDLPPAPPHYSKVLPEVPGQRALFAIMDQGSAAAYAFPTASLVNAAGHPVAATTASVAAAVSDMKTNADGVTQHADFASRDAAAYPLTVVDYAMVPTCGLSSATAAAVGTFLDHVVSSQVYGLQPGTLAPGYQTLNDRQKVQTGAAAAAVRSPVCPASTATTDTPTPTPAGTPVPVAGSGGGASLGGGGGAAAGSSTDASQVAAPVAGASTSASAGPTTVPVAFGAVHPETAGWSRYALPVLLGLGALFVLGGPGVYAANALGLGSLAGRGRGIASRQWNRLHR